MCLVPDAWYQSFFVSCCNARAILNYFECLRPAPTPKQTKRYEKQKGRTELHQSAHNIINELKITLCEAHLQHKWINIGIYELFIWTRNLNLGCFTSNYQHYVFSYPMHTVHTRGPLHQMKFEKEWNENDDQRWNDTQLHVGCWHVSISICCISLDRIEVVHLHLYNIYNNIITFIPVNILFEIDHNKWVPGIMSPKQQQTYLFWSCSIFFYSFYICRLSQCTALKHQCVCSVDNMSVPI